MSKKGRKGQQGAPPATAGGSERVLGVLAALGGASLLWALFLWRELIRARGGAEPFCGFGGSDCGALWDAAFASRIHDATGVPVAGWGAVWGAVACLLPLLALSGLVERRAARLRSATMLTAAAGVAGIGVLLAASAAAGMFCTSCALTYVLTLLYAVVAFFGLRAPLSLRGAPWALAAVAAGYVLALYPGMQTPKSAARSAQEALAEATRAARRQTAEPRRSGDPAAEPGESATPSPGPAPELGAFLAELPEPARQAVSDSLRAYRGSPALPELPPRNLVIGPPDAPVRITEYTDTLCSHCATLYETFEQLRANLPAGSFNVDSRHFPLDGNCNAHLPVRGAETVRCAAARARICLEPTGHGHEYTGALFRVQQALASDPSYVYQLATPFIDRAALDSCMTSAATAERLTADVDSAWRYEPRGTPLVLINGRQGTAYGPFLYALVLAGADPDHPAFTSLPPPSPPHEGH